MKKVFKSSYLAVMVLLIVAIAAIVFYLTPANDQAVNEDVPTGGMIRVLGQWGSLTNNFNPFIASGQNAPGTRSALYEPIFFVSVLDGSVTPVLGTSHEWKDNNLKLVINTREGVKWSDGTSFTAKDVAFTFNYLKKYPALDLTGIWSNGVTKVEAVDNNTVEVSFSEPNTPLFRYIAHVLVVPEHIWSKIDDPSTFTNPDPITTGPFQKMSFSPQAVMYEKNPNYWMDGKPYVDKVAYQATKSNDTALLKLLKHEVDYSNLFVPDPDKAWVSKDEDNKYWWPVTNVNNLYLNMTKAPFDDVNFRMALAYAIDKQPLSDKAYYGVAAPSHPTGIIPGQQPEWVDKSLEDKIYSYNTGKAKEILKSAGYSWDNAGKLVNPDGKKVPAIRILVGAGWTDFISMAQMISESVKEIGVEMVIEQEPWNSYINSLMGNTYDTAICWGTGSGETPYDFYFRTLSSQFTGEGDGQAESNYSGYNNPVVDKALETFKKSSDPKVKKDAISTIQEAVVTDIPYIPLTDRTNFNVYQTEQIEGWPTTDDPYSGGDAGDELGARLMLLNLRLKK